MSLRWIFCFTGPTNFDSAASRSSPVRKYSGVWRAVRGGAVLATTRRTAPFDKNQFTIFDSFDSTAMDRFLPSYESILFQIFSNCYHTLYTIYLACICK